MTRKDEEEKSEYLISLFQKMYLSDIVERHRIANTEKLNELVDILSFSIGSLTNPFKISNTFIVTMGIMQFLLDEDSLRL